MTQEVFLLSYTKYGDHDAVLHCFCKENGFESFFAKGIYAPKNKKKAFLFPLNELLLYTSDKKKNIQNITKIEQKSSELFSVDIRKNSILFFISDLLNQVLRNENRNANIYSEISIFVNQLQMENFQSHLIFIFRLLKQQGLQPLFSDNDFLNPESGTFEDRETHHFFDRDISSIWKELIISQNPYDIKLSRIGKQNFLDSILVYFHYHFTDFREPKSLEIIKEIFKVMIVRAELEDIPTIQDLAKKSWNVAYADILKQEQIDYMLDLMYSNDAIRIHLENPNFQYYLIKENDECLGFIGFEFHQELRTTKLHRIYFLKEAQGKGLGKKALDFIKEEVRKIGDNRITLAVNKHNQAKSFYESQGFQVYDDGIFDISNGYVMDDYLMEFIL